MSYQVSPQDGTFSELTQPEAELLYSGMEALHNGERTEHVLEVFDSWCRATGAPDTLLVLSTVFPIKALLSLVRHYR